MSVQALGWVFDQSTTRGSDRLVLLSLANHAGTAMRDGAWECYPGIDLIAREAGIKRTSTVHEALSRLIADGHIERIVNAAPDDRIRRDRRPNLYRIIPLSGVPDGGTPPVHGVPDGVERGTALPVHGVPDGADLHAYGVPDSGTQTIEPSEEPSLEPSVASAPATKATRLPEQFFLSPSMADWAIATVPSVDVRSETAQFCDYWRAEAGPKARKLDWVAAWRTWMRRAEQRPASRNATSNQPRFSRGQDAITRQLGPEGSPNGSGRGAIGPAGDDRNLAPAAHRRSGPGVDQHAGPARLQLDAFGPPPAADGA